MRELIKEAAKSVGISNELGDAIYLAYVQYIKEKMKVFTLCIRMPKLGSFQLREAKYKKYKESGRL